MQRKLAVLLFVVVIGLPAYLSAQSASGIISPSRMVNWSNAGVQGGVQDRTSICATLSPGATSSQINNAIASCPSGQVVSLAAGTYTLTSGLVFNEHNNVTLRGAGGNSTFLVFTGNSSCRGITSAICVQGDSNWSGGPTNSASWTAGYSKDATSITLSSTTNLAIGSLLILDQADDSSDTGGVYVCQVGGVCSTEGTGGAGRSGRGQEQFVTVTGISGSTVSFTPGLYMPNWRSSQSPGAYWATVVAQGDGIENLSIDNSNSGAQSGIVLFNSKNCWVKGVRSLNSNRNHVWLQYSAHDEIIDSYFYGTQNGASQSYGVESGTVSDSLIVNNIFQHIVSPTMEGGANTGNVIAYNYSIDDYYPTAASWMMAAAWMHAGGIDNILYEGNIGAGMTADDIHGTHNFVTAFRNYYNGWETGKTGETVPIILQSFTRYYNFVGNVLGKAGYHTNYEDVAPNGSNFNTSIYGLGYSGNGSTISSVPDDAKVADTLLRWGNYDVATGGARWNTSEVPSGIGQYSNPVPSGQSLPASFFLSGKPGWWTTPWGSPPWPAIGPDVTGGPGPGGHAYAIPSQLCYNNTSKGGNGVLNFSAQACYSSTPAPTAPTGLGAVAH
jgi:hypothetical protein